MGLSEVIMFVNEIDLMIDKKINDITPYFLFNKEVFKNDYAFEEYDKFHEPLSVANEYSVKYKQHLNDSVTTIIDYIKSNYKKYDKNELLFELRSYNNSLHTKYDFYTCQGFEDDNHTQLLYVLDYLDNDTEKVNEVVQRHNLLFYIEQVLKLKFKPFLENLIKELDTGETHIPHQNIFCNNGFELFE